MIFQELEIQNFLSIEEARITFDEGVHLIQGVNHDMSPDGTESNGSGKSSIFEAPEWCMWGSLTRGNAKADDVINKAAGSNCMVRVVFENRGHKWQIIRSRKHDEYGTGIRWWVDGVEKTLHDARESDKLLADSLPMSKQVYRYAVQVGQGMPDKFLGLSESAKQELLSQIIDLSIYDRALDVATNGAKEADTESRTFTEVLNTLTAQVDQLRAQAEAARLEHQEFMVGGPDHLRKQSAALEKQEDDLTTNISNLQCMADEEAESYHGLKSSYEEAQELADRAVEEGRTKMRVLAEESRRAVEDAESAATPHILEAEEKAREGLEKWGSHIKIFEKQFQDLARSLAGLQAGLTPLENEQFKLLETPDKCPTCGQNVDNNHLAPRIAELHKAIEDRKKKIETEEKLYGCAREELVGKQAEHDAAKAKWNGYVTQTRAHYQKGIQGARDKAKTDYDAALAGAGEEAGKLTSAAQAARKSMDHSQSEHQRITTLIGQSNQALTTLQAQRTELWDRLRSHEMKASQLKERAAFAEKQALDLEKDLATKEDQVAAFNKIRDHWLYWKVNVPNLRAAAMEQILDYLNERIAVYMGVFSGGVMSLRLVQVAYGKSSKIKTELQTPGGSYEMSSGGERRRIDLAIYLALSDLLQATSGYVCNVLVADEIMDGLSPVGVGKFLDVLRGKSENETSVYVMTHNPSVLQSHSFDSVLTVERKNGKARIL
jgi:DNA repair exonuclease SbcCD ATPase subunit